MDVHPPSSRQSGVTLIEVLVAMLVLSIGLLGIASLHVHSLQIGTSALNRSRANVLANDLLERIYTNRQAVNEYNWGAIPSVASPVTTVDTSACFLAAATGTNDGCDPQAIAAADRAQWTTLLTHRDYGLPSGAATVNVAQNAGMDDSYNVEIRVTWQEGTDNTALQLNAIVNRRI